MISQARRHPGTHIYGRTTVYSRLDRAARDGVLPEREMVEAFVRGCCCPIRDDVSDCHPDCGAEDLVPWVAVYDRLTTLRPAEYRPAQVPLPAARRRVPALQVALLLAVLVVVVAVALVIVLA